MFQVIYTTAHRSHGKKVAYKPQASVSLMFLCYQHILTSSEIYNWTKIYDGVVWTGLKMNFGNAIFSANGILFRLG